MGVSNMAFCINCGQQLADGAKFCSSCGFSVETAHNSTQRCQEWAGKIIKCPSCGENLPSFVAICPSCRHELRALSATNSVKELARKIEEIEQGREIKKNNIFSNPYLPTKTDEQIISLIKTFPIPNTKEDLFEFLVLASANIDYSYIEGIETPNSSAILSKAWEAKFNQAYEKAKLSFGHTSEFDKIQNLYKNNKVKLKRRSVVKNILCFALAIVCITVLLFAVADTNADSKRVEEENKRLEAIVEEVYVALEEENYVIARAKATSLTFSVTGTVSANKASEKWDKTREELLKIIDEAEQESKNEAESDKEGG